VNSGRLLPKNVKFVKNPSRYTGVSGIGNKKTINTVSYPMKLRVWILHLYKPRQVRPDSRTFFEIILKKVSEKMEHLSKSLTERFLPELRENKSGGSFSLLAL
jgi:hypothetical protein